MKEILNTSPILFEKAYYLKLGEKGEWEKECINNEKPTIRIGFRNSDHEKCLTENWDEVRKDLIDKDGKKKGKATELKNQLVNFYMSDDHVLWVTFFDRKLYWCFAEKKVIQLPDNTKIRYVKGKWDCHDIKGNLLLIDYLSGKLTQMRNFRGTMCDVTELEYLKKRLNSQKLPEVKEAEDTINDLLKKIEPLIQALTPKDFELLIDLIFTNAGWQRISPVGGTEKDIDLVLMSPVTGNHAFVQIKSKSDMKEFKKYIQTYKDMKDQFHEMYYVVHTTNKSFNEWQDTDDIKLLNLKKISELVVDAGLISWLIKKTS